LTDTNILRDQLLIISDAFPLLNLAQRIETVGLDIGGRVVFTTNFGIEHQAIADAIFTQELEIDAVTLETGQLFSETYELWAGTERRYGRRILALCPDYQHLTPLIARQGMNGFCTSVEARSSQE